MKVKLISILFFCVMITDVLCCDKSKCSVEVPNHYHELKCKEIKDEKNCCTVRFECPELPNDGKCHFNGKTIAVKEQLKEEDLPHCEAGCFCDDRSISGIPKLTCATIECPELFSRPNPDSFKTFDNLNQCCGSFVHDEKNKTELAKTKCWVDNKEYVKGQKIYPEEHDCHVCLCKEGFDNSTIVDNPHCEKVQCNIEHHYADRLRDGCIPIYWKKASCCPITWRCPDATDELIRSATRSSEGSDDEMNSCKFGRLTLRVGDEVKGEKSTQTCTCSVPPMLHCIEKPE